MVDIIDISDNALACDFCYNFKTTKETYFRSNDVSICSKCVSLYHTSDIKIQAAFLDVDIIKPKRAEDIRAYLDDYIIGQSKAKKMLSVASCNHFKRLRDPSINKSNILLTGHTGCGKTLLVNTLAQCLDIPMATSDATSLTMAGYVGDDVEVILKRLVEAANGNIELAERGIVYIDEIDKIASMSDSRSSGTGDVSSTAVQQALLKMLEGSDVKLKGIGTINTSNILFICSGAFSGIEKLIDTKVAGSTSIGFFAEVEPMKVAPELSIGEFQKYGMIPEFLGRLPLVIRVDKLNEDDMVSVMTEPKNNIVGQYKKIFEQDDLDLIFTDNALRSMAKVADARGMGARGLRSIFEDVLGDIMYDIGAMLAMKATGVTICRETVEKGTKPKLVRSR